MTTELEKNSDLVEAAKEVVSFYATVAGTAILFAAKVRLALVALRSRVRDWWRNRCDACGKRGDVRYRGWHDEGEPMKTCIDCGWPE